MRRLVLITISLLGLPLAAAAQESEYSPLRAYILYGNAFRGFPGGPQKHNIGMGGDLVVWKGLGVGLEVGLHIKGGGEVIGGPSWYDGDDYWNQEDEECDCEVSLSANGSYHFAPSRILPQLEPFVTAGYSVATRSGPAYGFHFFNYGGGINYWFSRETALRLEVRDRLAFGNGPVHMPEFRVGLTFGFR